MGTWGPCVWDAATAGSLRSYELFLTLEKEGRHPRSSVMEELKAQCLELRVLKGEIQVGPSRHSEPWGPSADSWGSPQAWWWLKGG